LCPPTLLRRRRYDADSAAEHLGVRLGEAELARALGQETLQRRRRVLGPDHPSTLYMAQVAATDPPPLGDEAAEDDPSPPR
jgi:hypothetical protein